MRGHHIHSQQEGTYSAGNQFMANDAHTVTREQLRAWLK